MKEKLKSLEKVKLKSYKSEIFKKSNSESLPYSFNEESLRDDNDEDLYKSLLNEDLCTPSTSQEKGTMTDSSLQKKNKATNKSSGTAYKGLNNILQNISKNKADDKVPLVILSKSPHSKNADKSNQSIDTDLNSNAIDLVQPENDILLAKDDNRPSSKQNAKTFTSPLKQRSSFDEGKNVKNKNSLGNKPNLCYNDELPSSSSPDFQGFTSTKVNAKLGLNMKTNRFNDKKIKRKLFTALDKDKVSKENEIASLDHPYSHNIIDKVKQNPMPDELPMADSDYPHFVNRSVFGSPINRSPPDIMLHNDKINILRQMSKVFNDEKSAPNQSVSKSFPIQTPVESNEKIIERDVEKDIEENSTVVESVNLVKPNKDEILQTAKESKLSSLDKVDKKIAVKKSIEHEIENIDTTPVHLVSSYSINKNESIKVESQIGTHGEEIDIIDGFTFFSFETESEMINYVPPKSVKKTKKRKCKVKKKIKLISEKKKQPIQENVSDSSTHISSDNDINNTKDSEPNQQFEGFSLKSSEANTIEGHDKYENSKAASAFASNDLDQYLTKHAELNISFSIPKCRATENGVTKFDEVGNPISNHKSSLEERLLDNNQTIKNTDENILEKKSAPLTIKKKVTPTSCSPVTTVIHQKTDLIKNRQALRPGKVFVKRGGNLLPLSSIFKKPLSKESSEKEKPSEMIYVYHSGRLLTLAGSLTKINPTNSQSIKAKVALPRGHKRLIRHAQRVASRTVKAVEINKDLAEFALSALRTPNKGESINSPKSEEKKLSQNNVKPCKENILDILAAKFSISKEVDRDAVDSKNSLDALHYPRSSSPILPSHIDSTKCLDKNESTSVENETTSVSKIRWNHNDILKNKKEVGYSMDRSKVFKKNINRFPSLSREMKRLNMNFVSYNKDSDSEEKLTGDETFKDCKNEFCSLGCICDSLKCGKKNPVHCGRVECMFQCSCTVESWREGKKTEVPISIFPIFNADYEHRDNLALKEKDFKKTVVQTGSDVFMIGSEKKKRDIRIPQRFRDSNIWKTTPTSNSIPEILDNHANKENVPILPSSYKQHIKDFHLNVPWYDVSGASVWCMFHSCYDCYCLSDQGFYYESENEVSQIEDSILSSDKHETSECEETLPALTKPYKIIQFNLKLKKPNNNKYSDKGEWILKHWIHNAFLHSARTCGYDLKDIISKETADDLKGEYNPPLPKPPFVLGITLKANDETLSHNKKGLPLEASNKRKAIFYDGLGPGLSCSYNGTLSNEISSKTSEENEYLSDLPLQPYNDSHKIEMQVTKDAQKPAKDVSIKDSEFKTSTIPSDVEIEMTDIKSEIASNTSNNDDCEWRKDSPNKKEHQFSLYEMIKEEEKRGELEIDLTPKEQGKAILITESRFRKLINMNIIGITGLNKAGRCIIDTVNSTEDLMKMQRIQQLISSNSIDVGPNMKEIFSSTQIDQKIRYVMIRCDVSGKWEIVGVVQRKNKDRENACIPKPKRQKSKSALPAVIMNNLKFKPHSDSISSALNADESNSLDSNEISSPVNSTVTTSCDSPAKTYLSARDSLVLEEGDPEQNLPCISSVVSGDNPEIKNLISSPPTAYDPTAPLEQVIKSSNSFSTNNFILNQSSGKIFGCKRLISDQGGTNIITNQNPKDRDNILKESVGIDTSHSDLKLGNFLYCPRFPSPSSLQTNDQEKKKTSSLPSTPTAVTSGEKIRMLLFPSPTSPGKSILIPTLGEVPANYRLVLRKPSEPSITTASITNQPSCRNTDFNNLNSCEKIGFPFNFTTATAKQLPLVQSTSSRFPILPHISSKTGLKVTNSSQTNNSPKSYFPVSNKLEALSAGNINIIPKLKMNSSFSSLVNNNTSYNRNIRNISSGNIAVTSRLPSPITNISSSTKNLLSPTVVQTTDSHLNSNTTSFSTMRGNIEMTSKLVNEADDVTQSSNSPDVKCISYKKHDNCTAVDLSIKFKSIKLHWLSGTIKKSVLVNIFKMSKKINAPVSLSARNDNAQSSFLGMHQFCADDLGKIYPVLILGTKLKLVLATSKLSIKELFRSNTIKYLIKGCSGELSSYTYDVKGISLIKIASKKKEVGVKIHGLGEKIPVDSLREDLREIEFPKEIGNNSHTLDKEEIVISDSEDEIDEPIKKQSDLKQESEKIIITRSSRPVLVSPLKENLKASINENLSPEPNNDCLKVNLNDKKSFSIIGPSKPLVIDSCSVSKPQVLKEIKPSEESKEQLSPLKDKLEITSLPKVSEASIAPFAVKHVLKVPVPFPSKIINKDHKKIETTHDHNLQSDALYEGPPNIIPLSNTVKDKESTPETKNLDQLPQKENLEDSENMAELLGSNLRETAVQDTLNTCSEGNNLNAKTHASTTHAVASDNVSHYFGSSEEEKVDIEEETGVSYLSVLRKQLEEYSSYDQNPSGIKRKLDKGNADKPCPRSKKKPMYKKNEPAPPQSGENSKITLKPKAKGSLISQSKKAKPNLCGSTNNLNDKRGSSLGNHSSAQEFQQVFSGAPQFWLMDNTEKHNTLERIRRKGLARMLENLYNKANNTTTMKRFPPKHVILKKAEEVIMELRSQDIIFAKSEIELREKKTQLLNALSELLKDSGEELQKQFELWISTNINNPMAKSKFEESWTPENVIFDDEHILTNSCGELTVSGSDITSYFATHTAGFAPSKSPPKSKGLKTQLKRKFQFKLSSPPKAGSSSHSLKSKLPLVMGSSIKSPRKPFIFHSPRSPPSIPAPISIAEPVKDGCTRREEKEKTSSGESDDRWLELLSSTTRTEPKRFIPEDRSPKTPAKNDYISSATTINESFQSVGSEFESKLRLSPGSSPTPGKNE